MAQFKGIDVSEHNGVIDWSKVKSAGIQFAMIRAGYGRGNIDKQFVRTISECNRLGIPCGVYWFSYAYTVEMARNEAKFCLGAVKPYKLDYPIAFDFEYDSANFAKKKGVVVTEKLVSDMTRAFCGAVEQAGFYALNYSNGDYLARYFDDDAEKRYGLWLAAPGKSAPTRACQIWQYGWNGSVAGISGNVDMNIAYVNFPAIINKAPAAEEKQKKWYEANGSWEKATMLGLVDGTRPEDKVTRAEMAVVALRLLQLMKEG